jgi:hypothetical protein
MQRSADSAKVTSVLGEVVTGMFPYGLACGKIEIIQLLLLILTAPERH